MSRFLLVCAVALLLAPLAVHAQTTLPNIDDTSRLDWQHCTDPGCSGGNGNSTAGVANITESDPFNYTIDGSSLRFDLAMNGCSQIVTAMRCSGTSSLPTECPIPAQTTPPIFL